ENTCQIIYFWLLENPQENLCLLLDEIRFIKNPESNRYFDWIVRCTKRNMVTVEMTCHGIVDTPPTLRRIADFWILFQLTQDADIDTVRQRCGVEVAEQARTLKPYEYIVWDDSLHRYKKHSDPAQWFVSLEKISDGVSNAINA